MQFARCAAATARAVLVLVAASGLLSAGIARGAELAGAPYIEVTGEAETRMAPDTALLDFGVSARADTAAAAAQESALRMKAVLEAVRKALGPQARIGTGAYSLRPEYSAPREGTPGRVTGYTASNSVRLETPELARLGELIDVAIAAGANQVQRVSFTLRDAAEVRRRALHDAVLDAQSQAQTIAASVGVALGAVRSVIEEPTGPVRPFAQDVVMARAEAAPTPIEPGLVSVQARVRMRVEIAR